MRLRFRNMSNIAFRVFIFVYYESTRRALNRSWRNRYSCAPRFHSSIREHSTSSYQPITPLSSKSRPEQLSVRSSCYSFSTNHPNPSDHCDINHLILHGQQHVNGGSPENVNAFNPQPPCCPHYTNTSLHQPSPAMHHNTWTSAWKSISDPHL